MYPVMEGPHNISSNIALLHALHLCFTEHWSVLMLSTLIQFGPLTKKGDIEAIEKVQKRATKLVISFKKLPYKERLLQLNLHTLKYRRLRERQEGMV